MGYSHLRLSNHQKEFNKSIVLNLITSYSLKIKVMNWLIIIIFGILVIALIVFLITRNQKDEKDFEKELDNEYSKSKGELEDIEIKKLKNETH